MKRILPQALVWAGMIVLGGAIALAQSAPAAAAQRTDGQIEMDVVHALDASNALKKDLITAATIQSEVTLAGTVSSEASKELAESIAARVPGVTAVHNNLKVGDTSQEAQPPDAGTPADDANAQPMPDGQPGSNEEPMPPPQGLPQAPVHPQDQGQQQAQAPVAPPLPPPPPSRPQYVPMQPPPPPTYEAAKGPVTVPAGTLIQVRTSEPVDSKRAKDGTPLQFTVIRDVVFGGVLAIPRGATIHGVVAETKHAGQLAGSAELALKLTSLDLGGKSYELDSDLFKVKSPNKAGRTAGSAFGGALLGAIIGGAVDRGPGAAIGAAAGAGAGVASSAASSGPGVWIPAEALVDFHLAAPITVNPVSQQEAARLAEGLYPGGPSLYRRGGYYRPGPYGQPYYAYPPVYYRPYYVSGGYYYWR